MSQEIKVMTFNLRVNSQTDGINHFDYRKPRILKVIADEAPDLIGFQEARDHMRTWLREELTDYMVIGCGRYPGYIGESAPLAFRKDKFEMLGSETFWLSSTPSVPGSIYDGSDQSECPRMCTVVTLKHHDSDDLLLFVNTHTDHEGALSRTLASAQLLQYMSGKNMKTVLTGDFNALPDSTEMKMLTSAKHFPLTDCTEKVSGTYHSFGKIPPEEAWKIDYIYTNLPTDAERSYKVEDVPVDGVYISDHQPVVAFVEL